MESTSKFEKLFLKALQEDMTAGAGGALGTPAKPVYSPESPTSGDTYAPGDARRPKVLGSVQTRKGSVRKKKKKKKGINFATGEENAEDRCKRKADSVYGKKTSAYKSGAIVRCRRGKIWKKKK